MSTIQTLMTNPFLTPVGSMDDDILLPDVDGNPVAPLEDQLQVLLMSGVVPEFVPAGDGSEDNGDLPKITYLI